MFCMVTMVVNTSHMLVHNTNNCLCHATDLFYTIDLESNYVDSSESSMKVALICRPLVLKKQVTFASP